MKKNKKVIIGAISGLALVSIATIGFSTWVVGVEQETQNPTVTAVVDDVENNSIYLQASISEGEQVKLAQTASVSGGKIVNAKEGGAIGVSADAMKFSFENISLVVGNNVTSKPTAIKIELITSEESNKFNYPADDPKDLIGKREGTNYTYITLNTSLTLPTKTNETFTVNNDSESGYTTYTLNEAKKEFSFEWGTFFGNKLPTSYYNDLYTEESNYKTLFTASANAGKELKQMAEDFKGQTITLTVSLEDGE